MNPICEAIEEGHWEKSGPMPASPEVEKHKQKSAPPPPVPTNVGKCQLDGETWPCRRIVSAKKEQLAYVAKLQSGIDRERQLKLNVGTYAR